MVLVGNKLDLCEGVENGENQRMVSKMAAEAFATANDMHYFETSAKDGTGVQELMDDVMG